MPHFCSVCQHSVVQNQTQCVGKFVTYWLALISTVSLIFSSSHISPRDHLLLEGLIRFNRLAPEGRWGPESHPRRCSVLWVFSQVSVCESLLCLDRRLKEDVKSWNDLYFWSVSFFCFWFPTMRGVHSLESSLLPGLLDVSFSMLLSLQTESCLSFQKNFLKKKIK